MKPASAPTEPLFFAPLAPIVRGPLLVYNGPWAADRLHPAWRFRVAAEFAAQFSDANHGPFLGFRLPPGLPLRTTFPGLPRWDPSASSRQGLHHPRTQRLNRPHLREGEVGVATVAGIRPVKMGQNYDSQAKPNIRRPAPPYAPARRPRGGAAARWIDSQHAPSPRFHAQPRCRPPLP